MEKGMICTKTTGRKAGKHCVFLEEKDGMYNVLYANGKTKKCNPKHLWFIGKKTEAKDEKEIAEKLKELDLNG